jgi:epoxyqueuosine reductase
MSEIVANRHQSTPGMIQPDYSLLDEAGLNLRAIFPLDQLSAEIRQSLGAHANYRQLILVGNGGPALWTAIKNDQGIASADPIDDFSLRRIRAWLAAQAPGCRHEVVYPGHRLVGLQSLGALAGWHFASPFMVGINARWGTWFAYRGVLLADTDFAASVPQAGQSPCVSCRARWCVVACPAHAMGEAGFALEKCVGYRRQPGSACRASCLARLACPVGSENRYDDGQIRHSYSISLQMIKS